MNVTNKLQPEPEQFAHLQSIDGPVCLVNLLKFRKKAEYPDGRDAELSGMDAFMRYAMPMGELIESVGRTTMTSHIGDNQPEIFGKFSNERLPNLTSLGKTMQKNKRCAFANFLIVKLDIIDRDNISFKWKPT